jgi:hypothetical protein
MKQFERQIKELEKQGYSYNGKMSCGASGGDHHSELWTDKKNKTAEVCYTCGIANKL